MEVHWRALLDRLIRRGLKGFKLIVSNDHAGLKAARRTTLPNEPWQRSQFHLLQRTPRPTSRAWTRKPYALRIRSIFNSPDKAKAKRLLRQSTAAWKTEASKLGQWAEENLPEGFTVFDLPHSQCTRLRTTNGLERIKRQIKRRTRVASIFPDTASGLRRVSALLAECNGNWMTGKVYLNLQA